MDLLKKYASLVLVLDIIWAALFATFGTSLLSAFAGVPAESLTGITGWIVVFVAAFFQGAIFALVLSVFGTIAMVIYAKSPPVIRKIMAIALIVDLIWGAIIATFGAGVLGHAASQIGVDGTFSAVLLWFIAFVAGCIQGAVFIGVGSAFLVILALIFGRQKNSDSGRPSNDRNPGEPPHR